VELDFYFGSSLGSDGDVENVQMETDEKIKPILRKVFGKHFIGIVTRNTPKEIMMIPYQTRKRVEMFPDLLPWRRLIANRISSKTDRERFRLRRRSTNPLPRHGLKVMHKMKSRRTAESRIPRLMAQLRQLVTVPMPSTFIITIIQILSLDTCGYESFDSMSFVGIVLSLFAVEPEFRNHKDDTMSLEQRLISQNDIDRKNQEILVEKTELEKNEEIRIMMIEKHREIKDDQNMVVHLRKT